MQQRFLPGPRISPRSVCVPGPRDALEAAVPWLAAGPRTRSSICLSLVPPAPHLGCTGFVPRRECPLEVSMTPFHREGVSPRRRRSVSPSLPPHPLTSSHPDPLPRRSISPTPCAPQRNPGSRHNSAPGAPSRRSPSIFPPRNHAPPHPPTLSGAPLPPRPPRASSPPHSPPASVPLRPAEGAPRMPTGHPRSGTEAPQRRGPDPSVLQPRAPGVPSVWVLTCRLTLRAQALRLPNTGALSPGPRARRRQPLDSGSPSGLGVWGSPTSRS